MKASVATTAGLSAKRSSEGLSLEEGEVYDSCKYYPLRFARPPNLGGQYRAWTTAILSPLLLPWHGAVTIDNSQLTILR